VSDLRRTSAAGQNGSAKAGGWAAWAVFLLLVAGAILSSSSAADKASKGGPASDNADEESLVGDHDDGDDGVEAGYRLEKVKEIVLWNTHNGHNHDSGAQNCNVSLWLGDKEVWSRNDVEVPWDKKQSEKKIIEVPAIKADKIRVEITSWNAKGGGLSEIEVLDKTGLNLALGGEVTTSANRSAKDHLDGATLNDENYYSPTAEAGYWLLPEGTEGWAEIKLQPQKIPEEAKERKAMKQGKKQLSRTPMGAELFVTCEDKFELYINGERTLCGHGDRVFTRHISIANGDIVTARCTGSDTKGGFCALIRFPSKHFLSTMNGWGVMRPADEAEWWDPDGAKPAGKAAAGNSGYASRRMEEEVGAKIPQIWGTGKVVYLAMQADTRVKHVKPKAPQRRR